MCGRRAGLLLGLGLAVGATAAAGEARWQLLMFDADDCSFCEQWQQQVGVVYGKTREGRLAPLARAPLAQGPPARVTLREPVRYAPTFVLLDAQGHELGRITGYPGEDHFWGLLEALMRSAGDI